MRIVYITPVFLPSPLSGSEYLVLKAAKAALLNGDEVIVLTSFIKNKLGYFSPYGGRYTTSVTVIDGIKIRRIRHAALKFLFARVLLQLLPLLGTGAKVGTVKSKVIPIAYGVSFPGLEKEIETLAPQIVFATPLPHAYTFESINAARRLGIPSILIPALHINEEVFRGLYATSLLEKSLEMATTVICTTDTEKNFLNKYYEVEKEKVFVVPIGIEENHIQRQKTIYHNLISQYRKKGYTIFLFLGTRTAEKGLYQTIHALHLLREKTILLVGGMPTIGWKCYSFFHKEKEIIDLPYLSEQEKSEIFCLADIFVLPSIVESYGIVYIEAMQHKLPIIYANVRQQVEIIGNTGIAVDFHDTRAIAKAARLLIRDKQRRQNLGKLGYARFQQRYTYRRMVTSLQKIYSSVAQIPYD